MSDMTREEAIEVIEQDIPCEHDRDLIEALDMAISALKGFEGMTNGEVIQALFPHVEVNDILFDEVVKTNLDKGIVPLSKRWWNAPYKAESEDKEW